MNKISFPLNARAKGPQLRDLHDALQLFLERAVILRSDERSRRDLAAALQLERDGQTYGSATGKVVSAFQQERQLTVSGAVDEPTANALNRLIDELSGPGAEPPAPAAYMVKGTVHLFDGFPAAGLLVSAFDRDLRSEQLLGRAVTDNVGHYEIAYTSAQFARLDKKSADLIVRAYQDEKALAANQPMANSAIIFNAKEVETVDLVVGNAEFRGPSEYEQIGAELKPLLEGVPPAAAILVADLTDEEILFLAGETELDVQHISFFAAAAKLGKRTGLATEIFYGFARENLPTDLSALLAQNKQVHRRALEDAVSANIIPSGFGQTIDQTLEQLQQTAVKQAFEASTVPGRASPGELLKTSDIPDSKLTEFLTLQVKHEGSPEEFWKNLHANPSLAAVADDLQFTLQVGALTQNYLPMAQQIQAMKRSRKITTLRDLAKMDANDWKQIITTRVERGIAIVGFPPDTPGNNDQEKIDGYAASLTRFIEAQFPTDFLAARIQKDTLPGKDDLAAFFTANPGFDLKTSRIDKQQIQNIASTARIADTNALAARLGGVQRLFKLTPRYAEMRPLLADGIDSAHSITRMGKSTFVAKYAGSTGGADRARAVYERAAQVSATSLHLLSNYGAAFNKLNINVLPSTANLKEIPEWQTLFGSLDLCECEHCRSLYSPAAYMVDALSFLNHRKLVDHVQADGWVVYKTKSVSGVTSDKTAKDALFDRRPDIGSIQLTCDNTNTPVPYVDLVNEVLENAISPTTAVPDVNRQTSGTVEELGANPQYLNAGAYDLLSKESYPWTLPFNLWNDEARIYLERLGVLRHELMRTFQRRFPRDDPAEIAIVTEYLGLTTVERQIITGESPTSILVFWGYPPNSQLSDASELNNVRVFLERSGLTHVEITELLKCRWINFQNTLAIVSSDPSSPGTCDIQKQEITNLNVNHAGRIMRFVRLWRALGWTMRELDQAFIALNPPSMGKSSIASPANLTDEEVKQNEEFLTRLAHVRRLREELRVSITTALAWYAPVDTALYTDQTGARVKSLYETLFQNPTVIKLQPGETDYFALNAARADMINANSLRADAKIPATLRGAFQIGDSDLTLLIDEVATPGKNVTLDNLSRMYRTVSLARALKLTIRDFLRIRSLTKINPFVDDNGAINTAGTLRFVEVVGKMRASGWSVDDLYYLLRHEPAASSNIVLTESDIARVLSALRVDLRKIADENTVPDSPWQIEQPMLDDLLRKKISLALGSADAEKALSLLENAWASDPAAQENVYWDTLARFVIETPPGTEAQPGDGSRRAWVFPTKETVLRGVLKYLRRALGEDLVTRRLSEYLKLSGETTASLLSKYVKSPVDAGRSAMTVFLSDAFINSDSALTSTAFAEQFRTLTLLHKSAVLINRYSVTQVQLKWLFSYSTDAGWLNPTSLPVVSASHSSSGGGVDIDPNTGTERVQVLTIFDRWERLNDLFALRDSMPGGENTLSEVFEVSRAADTTQSALLKRLSLLTGWNASELDYLAGANGLNVTFPLNYQDERALARLRDAFKMSEGMGVSVPQCRDLAKADLNTDDARNIKQAVRAKCDEAQWLEIAKPLRDQLREQQRAALVSYLVTHPDPDPSKGRNWKDANDLYSYFLIDVEMSPCQMTSRIKQANSSVQLFVQRCLMNLETEIVVNTDIQPEWLEWKWMKNYRVWEANRKVFLYPENWIEPELRDNKSPFFKELENELLQNEVTADTAETALLNYLEKLDAVSRLEVCGMYHEEEKDADGNKTVDILHVFGRTQGIPHIYYYRRRMNGAYWTPWDKVDLDIEGDHLIPVVWNRRLMLCWPIFTEKSFKAKNSTDEPPKYWEIKLAWSEFKNNKWAPKRISKRAVIKKIWSQVSTDIYFKGLILNGELSVRAYSSVIGVELDELKNYPPYFPFPIAEFRFKGCSNDPEAITPSVTSQYILTDTSQLVLLTKTRISGSLLNEYQPLSNHADFFLLEGEFPLLATTGDIFQFVNWVHVLGGAISAYRLLPPHQDNQFAGKHAFFFQDEKRTFFVTPDHSGPQGRNQGRNAYQFDSFYHPYLCLFIKELNRTGIDGLFSRKLQIEPESFPGSMGAFDFLGTYRPGPVIPPYPIEDVDFSYGGAYSCYNWELFFHVPMLIANRLSQNQKFEDAQRWFHYIFDPTDTSDYPSPQKFWKTRPFFLKAQPDYQAQQIKNLLQQLAAGDPELESQVREWREHPFNPHLIARLRDTAYQKNVLTKYLDNLIAWGDQLFRRDSIESINEATQLYILAAEILGRRPEKIKSPVAPEVQTYNSIEAKLDEFSNALVKIEHVVTVSSDVDTSASVEKAEHRALPTTLYFCIPRNDKMLGYWDTIADRLFKIRHCMNIEGVVRQLALFEPPIDPALLVKATAAGLDIGAVLSDINAPLPHYRFNVMSQKATELCGELKSLGAALLSALEKRDAEALSLLRSTDEIKVLKAVRQVKERQIDESKQTLDGLNKSRDVISLRHDFYASIEFMNAGETAHLTLAAASLQLQGVQLGVDMAANVLLLIPDFKLGSPATLGTTYGGHNLGDAMRAFSAYLGGLAGVLNATGSMSATLGSYQRRWEDWKLQEKMAAKELEQVDKQIAAAEIRLAIAERDLENHDVQIENAKQVDEFMRGKFTNRDLYDWMVSQISGIYFQSYQMAYDVAKRAERTYRFELGLEDSSFIQFGYWDSLKKGLLAGERLYHDIKRMEVAYLDLNKREYEITKHISLAMNNPLALITLRETGKCDIELPESLFDMDYPGHYLRRARTMSLTIPCVVGPYTSINCTLTLLKSQLRKNTTGADNYVETPTGDDPRFVYSLSSTQSIATSGAQNDSGLFELNFRDERYLPFELMGAISRWRIEMPKDTNAFDFDTISDVVLQLRYTARDGGAALRKAASDAVETLIADAAKEPLARLFSLRHEFPNEWNRFLHPADPAAGKMIVHSLPIDLGRERFPFQFRAKAISTNKVMLFLKVGDGYAYDDPNALGVHLRKESVASTSDLPINFVRGGSPVEGLPFITATAGDSPTPTPFTIPTRLTLEVREGDLPATTASDTSWWMEDTEHKRLRPDAIEDIWILCEYSIQA